MSSASGAGSNPESRGVGVCIGWISRTVERGCAPVGPKRVEGIEPSSLAWKAIALPLSYTRAADVAGRPPVETRASDGHGDGGMRLGSAGFEPAKA